MQENNQPTDFYLELVNNMPHSVLVTNKDRQIIFCNKVLQPTFGNNVEYMLKDTWIEKFDVYTVDKKHKFNIDDLPITRAIKGELLIAEKMFIIGNNCDGIFIKMCAYPIIHKKEEITVIIFEDITLEQQVFEDALIKLEAIEDYLKKELKIDYPPKNKNKRNEQN